MMARTTPAVKPLERSIGKGRKPKTQFIIVSEGEITEPYYFRKLKDLWHYPLLDIRIIEKAGVPTSVVERAIEEFKSKQRETKKNNNSFEIFEVWALFDRDNFTSAMISEAFQQAEANNIKVAHSNPCFELWGLMHFGCYAKPGHHHAVHKALTKKIPTYHHDKNPIFCPSEIMDKYEAAVNNSEKAIINREGEGTPHPKGDPSTNVHLLTEAIRKAANVPMPVRAVPQSPPRSRASKC
ncbi:RloB family protein [Acidovorax sp. Root217]|uniref:RloB family protein n=1 Tax=Acidovorax sp. Root217 TaxID=1736492 RepID=UPI0009E6991C|nr:RloB family protein [Acidovorax sp. Root217]